MQSENRWRKCRHCQRHVHELQWGTYQRCPFCRFPDRLTVAKRIELTFDHGSFVDQDLPMKSHDGLNFPGYQDKIERYQKQTQQSEAIRIGTAQINGIKVATGIMDNQFMMGTLNTTMGSAIRHIMHYAHRAKMPLILFTASGGARMQEGIFSLLQMNTILAEQRRLKAAGILNINVLTDPTMGGVSASFGFNSDYVIAEDHAQIGFSGKRVIKQTTGEQLPVDFQQAEYLLSHGQLDEVVNREHLRSYLSLILKLHGYGQ